MSRCPFAVWDPSPNYTPGWPGTHFGVMEHSTVSAFDVAVTYLKTPRGPASTSAHFVIRKSDGLIKQLVDTRDRAWHAMACNEYYIGVEHDDGGDHADPVRTPALYAASARLNRWLAAEHGFTPSHETLQPHYNCVATRCPSGLDLERILMETLGVEMLSIAEFEKWVADFRGTTIAYIADRLAKDAHHTHGEPIEPLTVRARKAQARRIYNDLVKTLPPMPKVVRPKGITKAAARSGHGATPAQYAARKR